MVCAAPPASRGRTERRDISPRSDYITPTRTDGTRSAGGRVSRGRARDRSTVGRRVAVSIVRVGMAEDGKFADGYEAIFSKSKKKPAAKPAAKAAKKPAKKPAAKKK